MYDKQCNFRVVSDLDSVLQTSDTKSRVRWGTRLAIRSLSETRKGEDGPPTHRPARVNVRSHGRDHEPTFGGHNRTGIQVERADDGREEFVRCSAKLGIFCAHVTHGDVKQSGADIRKSRESLHARWVGRS
jgi:hypothetical protein